MNVFYVCTNFNNSHDTVRAVNSLLEGDGGGVSVVVVDNKSNDEHKIILQGLASRYGNKVTVIESSENVGYFRGLNIGLKHLMTFQGSVDIVVIGNNDLIFPKNFVECLSKVAGLLKSHSVLSPSIVTLDGEHQNPHVITAPSKLRELMYDLYHTSYFVAVLMKWLASMIRPTIRRGDEDRFAETLEIEQGHGACYLLGPKFLEEHREFWAPTFLFGEEYFLSLQLKRRGEKVLYDPRVQVVHSWHASIAGLPGRRQWELSKEAHKVYRKYNPYFSN